MRDRADTVYDLDGWQAASCAKDKTRSPGGSADRRVSVTHQTLFRFSATVAIAGCTLAFIGQLISALTYPGQNTTAAQASSLLWLILQLITLVGGVLLVLGLPGIYAWYREGFGLTGFLGILLLGLTALLFVVCFQFLQVIVFPFLAQKAPQLLGSGNRGPVALFFIFIGGTLIQLVGTILLVIPFLRRRVAPRWVGFTLIASLVLLVIDIPFNGGNVLLNLLGVLSPLFIYVSIVGMGLTVLGREPSPTTQVMAT